MTPEHWYGWLALGFLAMGFICAVYAMFTDRFDDMGRL